MSRNRIALISLAFALLALPLRAQENTCLDCHGSLDGNLKITSDQIGQDVHIQKGLTCASCHGGDPTSAEAMDPKKGFKGHIARAKVPELCASCHANADYMRGYNPSLRTDQLAQYKTSVHGKKLAAGDTKVAVCIDCHGVHGIRAIADTRAKVNPVNVAQTCARCHNDREYMKPYSIKTDQFAGYSSSVHHEALAVRGDLSAPTCTTCHGYHGATPPGVASVENVCSTCHALQAQLFDTSAHKKAFASAGLPGCVTCHSNHRIQKPNDTMIGTGPQSVCANCHAEGDAGFTLAASVQKQFITTQAGIARSAEILTRAEQAGMEVSQPQLELSEARDRLTKARVTMHSFQASKIDEDIKAARVVSDKTYDAGVKAMKERNYRRLGLGVSLSTIICMLIGLRLVITSIESKKP
ncbi:MAG: cytochrome c3 family protein [Terriglobales bacterium]